LRRALLRVEIEDEQDFPAYAPRQLSTNMIGPNEEGLYLSENSRNKNFLKVSFYEWFRELSPDNHMMSFNAICGMARGRFRDKSLAFAVSEIKKIIGKSDSESMYLPEEVDFIESFVKDNREVAEGLTVTELRDFVMKHVYGLV